MSSRSSWEHVVIVPSDHPLTTAEQVSLADTVRYPIITYNPEFSGRSQINDAYEEAGLEPDIRLTAMDADVIKTYVRLGMGVGIVSQMAVSNGPGELLTVLSGSQRFFAPSVTKIATLKGSLLRNYAYQLMEMLAPHLDAAILSGTKRRPAHERLAPLLSFAERTDLHGAQHGA